MKVMIIGAGKLGSKLAEAMVSENIDVTIIDTNSKVLERINEHMDALTVIANGIDMSVLKELDIENYDLLVASTDSDETNTVICSLAKKMGCKMTIARIRNPEYMKQLDFIKKEMGIDHIVNPDLATAQSIEKYLLKSFAFYSGDFASGKVQMVDFNIGHNESFVGKKLMDLDYFKDLVVTVIFREGSIIIPKGSTILHDNDVIHIVGKSEDIIDISTHFQSERKYKNIEKVMILGGGNVGYYLAEKLSRSKISVTLIEQSRERAKELSEKLKSVVIIHGDGTDIHLLEEEMLHTMDAFIGATGFDEQNLLMALMAKQVGVQKTIAKISRENYTKIIDRLGIDAALNPIYITTSNILKLIRGGKVVSVSLLLGGDAEVTEIILDKELPFLNKTLTELKLPHGVIIGAIIRHGHVIIPKGDSLLKANDRIVVFSLTEDVMTLKMFFKAHKGGLLNELWNRTKGIR